MPNETPATNPAPGPAPRAFARSLAVLVGIDRYTAVRPLRTAVADVELIAARLKAGHGYTVQLVRNDDATLSKLRGVLEQLERTVAAGDRVLFYFAGHGITSETPGQELRGFVVPQDAQPDDEATMLPMAELRDRLVGLPCHHLLLVADCCFAGALRLATRDVAPGAPPPMVRERFDRYVCNPARQLLASASYNQEALDVVAGHPIGRREPSSGVNSPFATSFARALSGEGDVNHDGVITASELLAVIEHEFAAREAVEQASQQRPQLISLRERDVGEYVFFDPDHPPLLRSALSIAKGNNPYRGLRSYGEPDARLFFGRTERTHGLLAAVEQHRRVLVVGPSGSGKSSLVAAGLLPALRRADRDVRIVGPFRPQAHPCAALAETGLSADAPDPTPTVLVVDQLDDVWTRCGDQAERQEFLADLDRLATAPGHRLVASIRSDFEGALRKLQPSLVDAGQRFVVPPPALSELREMIHGPAGAVALFFDPARLVDRIIADVAGVPGTLPLLSMVLSELYLERVESGRQDRTLTLEDYLRIGGATGSIGHALDRIHAGYQASERPVVAETLRRVLLRMVDVDGIAPVSRRVRRSELRFAVPGEDDRVEHSRVADVLDRLADSRVIVVNRDPDGEDVIEPAHDALVTSWTILAEWIGTEQRRDGGLALQRRIGQAAHEHAGDHLRLWDRDPRLLVARKLLDSGAPLNALEIKFLRDSQRRRFWRRVTWPIVVIAIMALLAALQRVAANNAAVATRRLAMTHMEQGRALLLDEHPRPMQALPYLAAARAEALDTPVLRMLFGQASSNLPSVALVHDDSVYTATFSPDGTRVITASNDGTARVWDATTGKPVSSPLEHRGAVMSAAFSADGTRVVTASFDRTARVWDARTGTPATPSLPHEAPVWTAAFSTDGSRVVTASFDTTARVWDARTGAPVTPPLQHAGTVWAAAFSADGTRVVTASADGTARIWDARTGTPVTPPLQHAGTVWAAAFSADGTRVVTASNDQTARVWDTTTGKPVPPPLQHPGSVHDASFSPDGTRVVTASFDGTARVWDVTTSKPATEPRKLVHQDMVITASFSADGTRVVTASADRTARVWDATTGKPVTAPLEHQGYVAFAAFSADGTRVVTASHDRTARVWKATGAPSTSPLEHHAAVHAAAFSADGTRVVTASADGTARVWDAATGTPVTAPLEHHAAVHAAAFSADGTRVVTASADGTARVWDAATGTPVTAPLEHHAAVHAAAFSADGTRVVTASADGTARVWDAATSTPVTAPLMHRGPVHVAAFSADGTRVVTASADSTARVWDAATGTPVTAPLMHRGPVYAAAFSVDGARLVTASADKQARVWDLTTGTLVRMWQATTGERALLWEDPIDKPLNPLVEQRRILSTAAFSADGARVVTPSNDQAARVWDATTGTPVSAPLEHRGAITAAAFSADGTRVVTASTDGKALVWDATTGAAIAAPLEHSDTVTAVAFSPDGTRIVTASNDHTARVWNLAIDMGSLDDWQLVVRCSPFALRNSSVIANPDPLRACPAMARNTPSR